jgi:hypothetical protein
MLPFISFIIKIICELTYRVNVGQNSFLHTSRGVYIQYTRKYRRKISTTCLFSHLLQFSVFYFFFSVERILRHPSRETNDLEGSGKVEIAQWGRCLSATQTHWHRRNFVDCLLIYLFDNEGKLALVVVCCEIRQS